MCITDCFAVQQKLIQHCKSTVLQFLKNANSSKFIPGFNKISIKKIPAECFFLLYSINSSKIYRIEQKVKNSQGSPEEEKEEENGVSWETCLIRYQATLNNIVSNWCRHR